MGWEGAHPFPTPPQLREGCLCRPWVPPVRSGVVGGCCGEVNGQDKGGWGRGGCETKQGGRSAWGGGLRGSWHRRAEPLLSLLLLCPSTGTGPLPPCGFLCVTPCGGEQPGCGVLPDPHPLRGAGPSSPGCLGTGQLREGLQRRSNAFGVRQDGNKSPNFVPLCYRALFLGLCIPAVGGSEGGCGGTWGSWQEGAGSCWAVGMVPLMLRGAAATRSDLWGLVEPPGLGGSRKGGALALLLALPRQEEAVEMSPSAFTYKRNFPPSPLRASAALLALGPRGAGCRGGVI